LPEDIGKDSDDKIAARGPQASWELERPTPRKDTFAPRRFEDLS